MFQIQFEVPRWYLLVHKDIKSNLKLMAPSELLKKYMYGEISISSEQVTKLIEMKNGEREKYDD